MRSEGFSFYILGVWVTLLLASASVCKRPPAAVVGAKLPCLWEKSQKRDFFDVSEAVVMSFCVAGVALRGAILWLHFQTMCYVFRGRRSTLDTSHVILCGRRSILDVSCCVFFANRIVSAARSGDKVQIP